jgi:hypothetical protein
MFKAVKTFIKEQWHIVEGNAKWDFIKATFRWGCVVTPFVFSTIIEFFSHAPLWAIVLIYLATVIFCFLLWCGLVWFCLRKRKSAAQEISSLEIESVPTEIHPTKIFAYKQYRIFQIAIHNKNTLRNINNVNVELVLLKDELSDDPNAQNLRRSYACS